MKLVCSIVFSLFVTATLWGETTPSAAPTTPSNQPAPAAGLQNQPTPMDINAWRMQRMLRLMGELKAMHAKLDEMKTNAAKVSEPAVKQQLQLSNELWGMMLRSVEEMTAVNSQLPRPQARVAPSPQAYPRPAVQARGTTPGSEPAKAAPSPEHP